MATQGATAKIELAAAEAIRTFDCKTPGCAGEARSGTGRHAYCTPCRVARGTALPDGTPIETQPRHVSRRRKDRPTGPFEARAAGLLAAGRALDLAVERYRLARPQVELALSAWRAALADAASAEETTAADSRLSPKAQVGGLICR